MFPDEAARADRRIAQRNLPVLEDRVRVASDFIRIFRRVVDTYQLKGLSMKTAP